MEKQILVLGIGGSACGIVNSIARQTRQSNMSAVCIGLDTDNRVLPQLGNIKQVSLAREGSLADLVSAMPSSVFENLLACSNEPFISEYVGKVNLNCGAGMWRAKALLMLEDFLSDEERKKSLLDIVDQCISSAPDADIELYTVASLAGGTGSALFLPLALYLKDYILKATGKGITAKAVLAGPDIYEDLLSGEQKVKAKSNSYAALRELNGVQVAVSCGDDAVKLKENAVSFSVNSGEEGALGKLFVSNNGASPAEGQFPFEKIYYFERTSGVNSLKGQEEIIADTVYSIMGNAALESYESGRVKLDPAAIYSGASLTRIAAAKKSVCQYIGRKLINEMAFSDAIKLYSRVEAAVATDVKLGITQRVDTTVAYRQKAITLAEEYFANNTNATEFFGISTNGEIPNLDIYDYFNRLSAYIGKATDIPAVKSIKATVKGIKMGEITAKTLKKQKKNLFTLSEEAAKGCFELYKSAVDTFQKKSEAFLAEVVKKGSSISVNDIIIKNNNKPDNPVFAFLRLCYLSQFIAEKREANSGKCISDKPQAPIKELPCGYLTVTAAQKDDKKLPKGRYASASCDRFEGLLHKNKRLLGDREEDMLAFAVDAEEILSRIETAVESAYLGVLSVEIDRLLEKYISIFESLQLNKKDAEVELKVSALHCSAIGGQTQFLFSSPEEKERFYQIYVKKLLDGEEENVANSIFCRDIAEYVAQNKSDDVTELVNGIVESVGKTLSESSFAENCFGKDIIESLFKAMEDPQSKARTLCAFFFSGTSVKTVLKDVEKGSCGPEPYMGVMISQKRELDATEKENLKGVITETLYDLGELPTTVEFVDYLEEDSLYIYRENMGITLGEIAFANEEKDISGLNSIDKAMEIMASQRTPMWNPYLRYDSYNGGALPLVNKNAEDTRKNNVAKALLYALAKDKLFPGDSENGGKKVYYYFGARGVEAIRYSDEKIAEQDFYTLWLWLQANNQVTADWSNRYDMAVKAEIADLPFPGVGEYAITQMKNRLRSADFLSMLEGILLNVAGGADVFGERLLRVGKDTVYAYCNSRYDETDEEFSAIYLYTEKRFCDGAEKSISAKTKKYFREYRKIDFGPDGRQ